MYDYFSVCVCVLLPYLYQLVAADSREGHLFFYDDVCLKKEEEENLGRQKAKERWRKRWKQKVEAGRESAERTAG